LIIVAFKTPLEVSLGICIYKTSLLHWPDDYIGFTPRCPPPYYNKIALIRAFTESTKSNARSLVAKVASSGVRRKFSWGGFQSAKIFLCTKVESMIRKNIKQAAIQHVNVVKQL